MKIRQLLKLFSIMLMFATSLSATVFANPAEVIPMPPAEIELAAGQLESEAGLLENAIPDEARELLGDIKLYEVSDAENFLERIVDSVRENGLGIVKIALKSGVIMLTIVLLCSLAQAAMKDSAPRKSISLCGSVAISAIAVDSMQGFIGLGMKTVQSLSDFSKILLPTLCAAAVSSGAVTSATAKYAATAMFMDILISIGSKLVLPLICAYIAAVIGGAALGKSMLTRVAAMLKWVCTNMLMLMVMAFTAYLSLTGLISGKADQVAVRAARSMLGTLLPIVGGVLSDAADTILAGAGIVRNSIGIFGLLVILAACLMPVLRLLAHYLVFKGTAALSEAFTDKPMAELISGIGSAFALILGLVGSAGLMLFISIYSSLGAMGGI